MILTSTINNQLSTTYNLQFTIYNQLQWYKLLILYHLTRFTISTYWLTIILSWNHNNFFIILSYLQFNLLKITAVCGLVDCCFEKCLTVEIFHVQGWESLTPKPITFSDTALLWHQQIKKDINMSCLSFSKKVEHHSWGRTDCMGPWKEESCFVKRGEKQSLVLSSQESQHPQRMRHHSWRNHKFTLTQSNQSNYQMHHPLAHVFPHIMMWKECNEN